MKKMLVILASLFALAATAQAATITIDSADDLFTGIGDYAAVGGLAGAAQPGQILNLLTVPKVGKNESEWTAISNTLAMGTLWSKLSEGGILSTNCLVVGMVVNETGAPGSNDVTIQDLDITLAGGSSYGFGENNTIVVNYISGASSAEARFQIDLGFDFMTTFNASSTEIFTISSVITDRDNGDEVFFLSSGFTSDPMVTPASPVPVPGAFWLLGSGLAGLMGLSRRRH